MCAHSIPWGSEELARLGGSILGLLVDPDDQRPWSEAELQSEFGSRFDRIPDALGRLQAAGLVHRWDRLTCATHAAVRFHEIRQSGDPDTADERAVEDSVLGVLLTQGAGGRPMSLAEIGRLLGARDPQGNLALVDAQDRLDAAGLLDRTGELAFASTAAVEFDRIMTL